MWQYLSEFEWREKDERFGGTESSVLNYLLFQLFAIPCKYILDQTLWQMVRYDQSSENFAWTPPCTATSSMNPVAFAHPTSAVVHCMITYLQVRDAAASAREDWIGFVARVYRSCLEGNRILEGKLVL